MKPIFFILPVLSFCLWSDSSFALVDYSEPVGMPSPYRENTPNKSKTELSRNSGASKLTWKSDISLLASYESHQMADEKFSAMNFNTHWQTPFNVYFDISYWSVNSKAGSQAGNPKAIIGFNWLRLGGAHDEARLDLYAGARLAQKSEFAASRTDKIFGVETTKRFGTFGLGLGYEVGLTGRTKNETEMSIGNIQRISFSGGWMVSSDIQFEITAENFKIAESKTSDGLSLNRPISFSVLSPKLVLGLAPSIGLEMGGRFRTSKIQNEQELRSAKLFALPGAYSNSLMAGLNLSI